MTAGNTQLDYLWLHAATTPNSYRAKSMVRTLTTFVVSHTANLWYTRPFFHYFSQVIRSRNRVNIINTPQSAITFEIHIIDLKYVL